MKISDKDIKSYIEHGGDYCPKCHSPEVQEAATMHYDEETSKAYRPMECLTCLFDWTEVLGKETLLPMKVDEILE